MKYNKPASVESKNNRETNAKLKVKEKNVIRFNPPYKKEVQTNIGKALFNLINKHFSEHHKLLKICNKFNIKLSYNYMLNMMSIINNYNKKLLHPHTNNKDLPCNCRNLPNCPLSGKCQAKSIIYKASISAPNSPTQHYLDAAKLNLRPAFTTTGNPITKIKQMPQNFLKQYGNIKTKESNHG